MNDSKIEFVIVVSSGSVDKVSIDSITIGDSSVSPSGSARNSGVIFDNTLCLNDHITKVCQTCHYWLKNIRRIRRCLSLTATQLLVQALVLSRLDYCNDLYVGLPQQQLGRLQRIQNALHASLPVPHGRKTYHQHQHSWQFTAKLSPTYVNWSSSTPCDVNYGRRAMQLFSEAATFQNGSRRSCLCHCCTKAVELFACRYQMHLKT